MSEVSNMKYICINYSLFTFSNFGTTLCQHYYYLFYKSGPKIGFWGASKILLHVLSSGYMDVVTLCLFIKLYNSNLCTFLSEGYTTTSRAWGEVNS